MQLLPTSMLFPPEVTTGKPKHASVAGVWEMIVYEKVGLLIVRTAPPPDAA